MAEAGPVTPRRVNELDFVIVSSMTFRAKGDIPHDAPGLNSGDERRRIEDLVGLGIVSAFRGRSFSNLPVAGLTVVYRVVLVFSTTPFPTLGTQGKLADGLVARGFIRAPFATMSRRADLIAIGVGCITTGNPVYVT